jgi:predicted DNA-binding helix-hairpin-helix protein
MSSKDSFDNRKDYRIVILLVVGIFICLNSFRIQQINNQKINDDNVCIVDLIQNESYPHEMRPFYFLPFDINQADTLFLQTIPGIGPRLSERIISLRMARNGFKALEELLEVEGIGLKKYSRIKKHCFITS